jgi:Pilus formation protein N terminal region
MTIVFALVSAVTLGAPPARYVVAVGSSQEIEAVAAGSVAVDKGSIVDVVARGTKLVITAKKAGETKIVMCEGSQRCTEFFVRVVAATREVEQQMSLKVGETKTLTFSKQQKIETEESAVVRVVSKDPRNISFEGIQVGEHDVKLLGAPRVLTTVRVKVTP